jgi:oligopeptide transport system substrate-binding protein
MKKILGAAFCLAWLTAVGGCSKHPQPRDPAPASLKRGLAGEPASLDPAAATDNYSTQVIQDLYEGLTGESSTGEVVPGVATSWTVDSTGTTYTFQLRSDARWSNGKPVRASEFVTAWRRVVDPAQRSPMSNELRVISGATAIIAGLRPPTSLEVNAPTDDVLVVKLDQPAPYFPQLLAHSVTFPVYSDAIARTHDPKTWVSNGPFTLSAWRPGSSLELTRNASYWDRANVKIEHVEYQIMPDQNSQFAAYRAGQLDMTDTVPPNAIDSLRREHSNELVIAPYLATAYFGLNTVTGLLHGNLKLRKALSMAIDRNRMVTALALGQIGAYGLVPPGTWNYAPQRLEWATLDDAHRTMEARRLYIEAGYSPDAPLRLRLLFNSNPSIKQTAIMIAAMWKEELGIDTTLTDEEFRVFLQSRRDKEKWDVVRLAWTADYNDASNFLDIFRLTSANNDTGYANPIFEKYLDDAAKTADQQVRRNFLEEAERTLLADYPIIPLYFFVSKRLVKPYVSGVKPNALDRVGSKNLTVIPH